MSNRKKLAGKRTQISNRYIEADAGKLIGAIITRENDPDQGLVRTLAALLMSTQYGQAVDSADELIDSLRELHDSGWMDVDSDGMAWLTCPDDPNMRVSASNQMKVCITDCPPDFLP